MEKSLTLSFEDAGISFAGKSVLRALSFTLGGGSVVAVRGANGSGKSTLLRLAAGLLRPTKGRVALQTAAGEAEGAAWQANLAYLSPELSLYPLLTAAENLDFFLGLRGIALSDAARRTLGADAPFWLLDEPGANLDEEGRTLLAALAREAAAEGRLVLWATNEQKEEVAADARICIAGGAAHLS